MFVYTNGKPSKDRDEKLQASKEAFYFLSGTGFDIMIQKYSLNYNAEDIRHRFYKKFNINE